jgi:hypothetical protein
VALLVDVAVFCGDLAVVAAALAVAGCSGFDFGLAVDAVCAVAPRGFFGLGFGLAVPIDCAAAWRGFLGFGFCLAGAAIHN